MNMLGRGNRGRIIRCSLALAAAAMMSIQLPMPASAGGMTAPPKKKLGSGAGGNGSSTQQQYIGPEAWIHGPMFAAPVQRVFATGTRAIHNLRGFNADDAISRLETFGTQMGACLTLRWVSPVDGKFDTPPTQAEEDKAIADIIKVVTSAPAKAMGQRLWVQMYNELASGPGSVTGTDMDAMMAFATKLQAQIKQKAPDVRISGPAMTVVGLLVKNPAHFDETALMRVEILNKILDWSVQYADGVDVHLHASGKDDATSALKITRDQLNLRTGGADKQMVTWEWSPARYPDQSDSAGVVKAINEIWQVMGEYKLAVAAYSAYGVNNQNDIFYWKSLVDESDNPRQPFFDAFTAIAKTNREALASGATNAGKPRTGKGSAPASGGGRVIKRGGAKK